MLYKYGIALFGFNMAGVFTTHGRRMAKPERMKKTFRLYPFSFYLILKHLPGRHLNFVRQIFKTCVGIYVFYQHAIAGGKGFTRTCRCF